MLLQVEIDARSGQGDHDEQGDQPGDDSTAHGTLDPLA
jgi:hypothetical protein